ncbi:LysR family transcriptional regulator [Nakamurella silvestris]|nr:LysR family transcriptional regulator [Nakamurella silvestris]
MNDPTLSAALPLLPVLLAVADTGQVTLAAAVLGLPQPTVSRQLARLSSVLGVPVVEKDGRGVVLSAAGRALLPYAREALAAVGNGIEEVRAQETLAHGTLSIAFQNTLGEFVVPSLIKAFLAEHPRVRFELAQGARVFCLESLDARRSDVAFLAPTPDDRSDLRSLVLFDDPLMVVLPPGHRLAGRQRVSITEVAGESFILLKHGFGLRSTVEELCRANGFRPQVSFEGDDIHTVRGLVSAGLGISVLPTLTGEKTSTVDVALDDPAAVRQIGASWRVGEASALATAFQRLLLRRGAAITAAALLRPRGV